MSVLMIHISELRNTTNRSLNLEEVNMTHIRHTLLDRVYDADMTVVFDGDNCKIVSSRFGKEGTILSLADLWDFSPWHTETIIRKRATIATLLEAGDWLFDTLKAIVNGGDPMAAEYALTKWTDDTKEYTR